MTKELKKASDHINRMAKGNNIKIDKSEIIESLNNPEDKVFGTRTRKKMQLENELN